MKFLLFVLFAAINYFVGSINFADVISKYVYHDNIREHGSGNPGATNMGRTYGKKAAYIVTACDALKGAICLWIESIFNYDVALLAVIFVAIGHCYPIYSHFKGGKAVATTFGIILAISITSFKEFIFVFIVTGLVWLAITKFTEYVSLASLTAILIGAVFSTFACDNIFKTLAIFLLWILIVVRHKDNIIRLMEGNENKKNY